MPANCLTPTDIAGLDKPDVNDRIEILRGWMRWYDGSDQTLAGPVRPWWWYPPNWKHPQREILRDITGQPYPFVPTYCGSASLLQAAVDAINTVQDWDFAYDTGETADANARALLVYGLDHTTFPPEN